jgi:DHA1 family multidrug resistance protein-like MFS transporter
VRIPEYEISTSHNHGSSRLFTALDPVRIAYKSNTIMSRLTRILSRPVAKPYRSKNLLYEGKPYLNQNGHLDFSPDDIENPKNWSPARRWYITFVAVLLVVNATLASSSPSGALMGISETFQVSSEAAGLVVTLFLLGYCFGPLFWAPLSEFYGRRYIFYISFLGYVIFNFLCAFANNFAALLIGRFLTGTFASSPLSNAPAVLADLWGPVERGNALALFSMMTFVGPALGPVISGFLELKEDWRWNFYVLLWFGAITSILLFTIPETLAPAILTKKAKRVRALKIPGYEDVKAPIEAENRTLMQIYRIALTRPWKILVDPISLLVAIYLSIVYMLLYMLFTIYPIVFQQKRGWNSGVGELPLIGTIVGAAVGAAIVFANSTRDRKKLEAGHVGKAEDRMPLAMLGGIILPISLFWFGWSANYNSVHWIVPTIAGAVLACSFLLIFVSYLNYLTDTYLMYAASAVAANTIARSACGAAAPLFTQYMFDALGVGGGASLLGGVAVLLAPIPFIFYKYGEPIRIKSKFAPTDDKKDEPSPNHSDLEMNRSHSSSATSSSGTSDTTVGPSPSGENYVNEGVGYDRVARPDDTREKDVGQLDGMDGLHRNPDKDVEK